MNFRSKAAPLQSPSQIIPKKELITAFYDPSNGANNRKTATKNLQESSFEARKRSRMSVSRSNLTDNVLNDTHSVLNTWQRNYFPISYRVWQWADEEFSRFIKRLERRYEHTMERTKRQQLAIVSKIKSTLESIASYEMSMAFKKDQKKWYVFPLHNQSWWWSR